MGNDDGFGSAQLREFYRLLKADGHDVLVVAPVDNQSGQGGRSVFTASRNLSTASEFNLVPAGSPSLGRDPNEPDIWYYNGTPAACTFVALDFVLPRFYDNRTIDLYVGGPNYGTNLGGFLYTLSGILHGDYAKRSALTDSGSQAPWAVHMQRLDGISLVLPFRVAIVNSARIRGSTPPLPLALQIRQQFMPSYHSSW